MRKEITDLIDNIKLHSDELTEKPHIPQLELELIASKIEKLYKKSIEFNYEYSLLNRERKETKAVEKEVVQPVEIKEQVIPATTRFPDLKDLIGINQKFQFTSELFGGNAEALGAAITSINSAGNKDEALKIAADLKTKFSWKDESPVADDFVKLVVKKFS